MVVVMNDLEKKFDERRKKYPAPSQLGQDALVLAVLNDMEYGVFVEIGVGNGIRMSNTYILEQVFGWSGLLVEPNPCFHHSIRETRAAILEPVAAFSFDNMELDFICANEVSTLVEYRNADCYDRVGNIITVPSMTMNTMLKKHGIHHFDYLSLDTEGSEMDVLMGLDLTEYRPTVINVEHNHTSAKQDIINLMADYGYVQVLEQISSWD